MHMQGVSIVQGLWAACESISIFAGKSFDPIDGSPTWQFRC